MIVITKNETLRKAMESNSDVSLMVYKVVGVDYLDHLHKIILEDQPDDAIVIAGIADINKIHANDLKLSSLTPQITTVKLMKSIETHQPKNIKIVRKHWGGKDRISFAFFQSKQ